MKSKLIFIIIFVFAFSGCGYSFYHSYSSPKEQAPLIYVKVNDAVTTVPELSWFLQDQIKTKLLRDYGLKIADKSTSQYELNIDILKFSEESSGYITKNILVDRKEFPYPLLASAYVNILFSVKLIDSKTNEILWAEPRIHERELYHISEDPMRNNYNLKLAISKISERVTSLIYTTGFIKF